MDIESKIEAFKLRVDDDREFLDLSLEDFIKKIALTKKEMKEAKELLHEAKGVIGQRTIIEFNQLEKKL